MATWVLMTIWAIADLHLSFGVSDKKMDIFGEQWKGWTDKIAQQWHQHISDEDLVLISGDISWAMRPSEAQVDLDWIGSLPGTKILIRGNHDYWWNSLSQVKKILPPSCHPIQNSSFLWHEIAIAGTRLWDDPDLDFSPFMDIANDFSETKRELSTDEHQDNEKIYLRELNRLEASLKTFPVEAKTRIVMTHYPPIGPHLEETRTSKLLEKYQVSICVFGHLHNLKKNLSLFGQKNHVTYYLTACDYLPHFCPLKIL